MSRRGALVSGTPEPAAADDSVPFFRHDLGAAELAAVAEIVSGPILTTGETVERFERRFADYLGRRPCVGLTSCTGALPLSLAALGIGPGEEVITTPMTFIASATSIIQAGATPVFADVEEGSGNIDASLIEAAITPRTRAILPVHLYGQMCDMPALRAIADRHGLSIVEDSAHCVEGARDGVRPGQIGETACFSFYATKSLTSGEGGALVTDDDALAARVRLLRHHGMDKIAHARFGPAYQHWDMVAFGWKYNMDNIQAALLLPQLDRIEASHARRAALSDAYRRALSGIGEVSLPPVIAGVRHAEHLFTIRVDPIHRDPLLRYLGESGIGTAVNYRAIHLLDYFQRILGLPRGTFPVAESIGDSTISLPLYATMPPDYVERVAAAIAAYFREPRRPAP